MKRDFRVFLDDILESIDKVEDYTKDLSADNFYKDTQLQDAIVRRFEIIGEAVKNIPQEVKDKYPEIPWKEISGVRDVMIHEYFGVNLGRIWQTIKEDILPFRHNIKKILQDYSKKYG